MMRSVTVRKTILPEFLPEVAITLREATQGKSTSIIICVELIKAQFDPLSNAVIVKIVQISNIK